MAPSVWKLLYHDLAGDSSTPPHELSKEMQERMRTILDLQDADIIMDLRINNGFHGTKFDIFWDELNEYLMRYIDYFFITMFYFKFIIILIFVYLLDYSSCT